ncbi:MAG: HD domain-containing phosphohydrolase [Gammaproteobacteria bacterium]
MPKRTVAHLEVLSGPRAGMRYPVQEQLQLGRVVDETSPPDCFVELPEQAVSRQHARIVRRDAQFVLQDLNSTNGTVVNGTFLPAGGSHVLHDGDTIEIGSTRLRYRAGGRLPSGPADTARHIAAARGSRSLRLNLFSGPEQDPNVSMALDASQLMLDMRGELQVPVPEQDALVRRLHAMAQVSIGLGAEHDRDRLMAKIMDVIFDIFPVADRAFVVLSDPQSAEGLIPVAARTREPDDVVESVALSRSIVNEVLRQKRAIVSNNAMEDARFDSHESIADLSIRSLMCVPLIMEEQVLGLMQIDTCRGLQSFSGDDLQILAGIGAQIAVALKNFRLYEEIENLFQGFVQASVHAIEARDPSTAGHSFRVAEYTRRLAHAVNREQRRGLREIFFNEDQMREIRYAALLHDFGKVGVREHVLTKAKKLHAGRMELVEERFRCAQVSLERSAYRRLIEAHEREHLSAKEFARRRQGIDRELQQELDRLAQFLELIRQTNEPTVSEAQAPEELSAVVAYGFPDGNGGLRRLLNDFEFDALTLSRGSLTPEERVQIECHVSQTFTFLSHMPWTRQLSQVPHIAHAHHEKLDGSGYPLGLRGDQIPIQSRIMTVADIYDALTAGDRPYKRGLPADQALEILADEARAGRIEQSLFELFVEAKAYELVTTQ